MSVSEELGKLGELHERGLLSAEEFAAAKAKVLADGAPGSRREPVPGVAAINALRRSTDDRWVAGVCGGLARSIGVESWILRLGFVLLSMFAGTGVLAYALMWLFVPEDASGRSLVQGG
jgi:phage shock protein PspC (stress-responsive transcriptional regulator)